ncbi:9333_t:CDS:2, partial [Racocetra fulgida]
MHIAMPISYNDNSEGESNQNENIKSDDDESIDDSIVNEEINGLRLDEFFLDNELEEDFNLAERNIHLADDSLAKWDLITLF